MGGRRKMMRRNRGKKRGVWEGRGDGEAGPHDLQLLLSVLLPVSVSHGLAPPPPPGFGLAPPTPPDCPLWQGAHLLPPSAPSH